MAQINVETITRAACDHRDLDPESVGIPITNATKAQILALLTSTEQHRQEHPGHITSLSHIINPQK